MGLQQVPPNGKMDLRDRFRAYNEVRQFLVGRVFRTLKETMMEMVDACESGAQLHSIAAEELQEQGQRHEEQRHEEE